MKVKLTRVRLAFPNLFEPGSFEGAASKFGAKFVIEPGSANSRALDEAMLAVAKEKWGDTKGKQVFDGLTKTGKPKNVEVAYVKEPYPNRDGDPYDGFDAAHYLSATNKARPTILDRDKSNLVAADGRPYAGCYVNASIEVWAQDNSYGRAIRAELKGVQFADAGDAFGGGGVASPDDFEDLSSGADAEGALA